MGVLNFSNLIQRGDADSFDVLAVEEELFERESTANETPTTPRSKRRRTKSNGGGKYDFREFGVDARRSGAKHQRRKQNLTELFQIAGDEEEIFHDITSTVFSELFMDTNKMKIWEQFMSLSDDQQQRVLEDEKQNNRHEPSAAPPADELGASKYMMVDKKIRDVLRSKHLAANSLLRYYEDDLVSCIEDGFSSILVLNHPEKYDRMLIYAICQFFELKVSRIRLQDGTTLIEIELPTPDENSARVSYPYLSDYLQ